MKLSRRSLVGLPALNTLSEWHDRAVYGGFLNDLKAAKIYP